MIRKHLPNADILVIGASVAGCGLVQALARRGLQAAIVDRAQVCAAEFSDALFTRGDTFSYIPKSKDASDFCEELCRRGILCERGISLPAVAPVISARLLNAGAPLYAPARITDIAAEADGYRVTLLSMGVSYALRCSMIVDTTASFESALWFSAARPALCRTLTANAVGEPMGDLSVVQGARKGEIFISTPVTDGDFDGARDEMLRRAEAAGVRVILSPMTAAEYPDCRGGAVCDTLIHLPSAGFENVVAAYDAGVRLGESLTVGASYPKTAPLCARDAGEWDIIVAGGGTAGAIAALCAARRGSRVLLLEDGICLGGMGTVGGILGYYYGVAGGLYEEIDRVSTALQAEGSVIVPMGKYGDLAKRIALGRALRQAGVTVRYEATAVDALTEGKRVHGVRFRDDSGLHEARAAYVIDATAEGVLLVAAGAETMQGRPCDNSYQPFSNVYAHYGETAQKAFYSYTDNGIVDPYDAAAMGHAILHSGCAVTHLKEDYQTGTNRYLGCSPRIGLREGQRIVGEECVMLEDLLAGRITKEPVLWGYSNLDNHGKDNALEDSLCRRWNTAASMWGYNLSIPVPAGALIPRGMEGILAAGRCIAVDHTVASAVRMKYDMQKSGEAAAVLATESIRRGCRAVDVPYTALRDILTASGCLKPQTLPTVVNISETREATVMSEGVLWTEDINVLRREMTGTYQGYAIWSASVHGAKLRDTLVSWLSEDDEILNYHAALALGLAGCEGVPCQESIPYLLRMARDKSGRTILGGRKYNYHYAMSAAVLLELLGVREAVDAVLPFVSDPNYAADVPFESCELTEDREDVIFQYTLQGFAVLCGLYRQFPEEREKIAAGVESRLYAPDFRLTVSGKAAKNADVRLDYTEKVRQLWKRCRAEAK